MNKINATLLGLLLTVTPFASCLTAPLEPDYGKEQRWATQIVDFLVDGEPVWLEADHHRFLGIFTASHADARYGAVILVHGAGVHPDWQQVIHPLRSSLPERGWATLSIQMPVLPNGAGEDDYAPLFKYVPGRIDAAVQYLQEREFRNIVLLGHSLGASMSSYYLAHTRHSGIGAFVGIGMKAVKQPGALSVLDNFPSLKSIRVPVLDVYGAYSNEQVIGTIHRRYNALKLAGVAKSKQTFIKHADHYFNGQEMALDGVIGNWLQHVFELDASAAR